MIAPASGVANARAATLVLCLLTALVEGMDLQSMGVAASHVVAQLHLSRSELGFALSASPSGLLIGAFIGGRLADLRGRKAALIYSMVMFGVFQMATVQAQGAVSLGVIRFLCGLGLGGALPNLIALTAEANAGRESLFNVVVTAAAMPLGGAVAACIGILSAHWTLLFYIGGILPIALAALMAVALPESVLFLNTEAVSPAAQVRPAVSALLEKTHRVQTWLLWVSFLGTTLVLYALVNYLPLLMLARGFTTQQSLIIQIVFNLGSAVGSVGLAWIMLWAGHRWVLSACYIGLMLSLLAFSVQLNDIVFMSAIAAVVGACVVGAQFILYGVAPGHYPTLVRGTGVGAAVAAGRLGGILGPLVTSEILASGTPAALVLLRLLPVVAAVAVAASRLMLMRRSYLAD